MPSLPELLIILSIPIALFILSLPNIIVIAINKNTSIGTRYSRLKYWLWSITMMVIFIPMIIISKLIEYMDEQKLTSVVEKSDITSMLLAAAFLMLPSYIWLNALVNRIRDYGSNPWIALWTIIPFVNILMGLYYGIAKSKSKKKTLNSKENDKDSSLVKAVYNHSKDIASEVKRAIDDYKEKHKTVACQSSTETTVISLSEDTMYEKIMLEIEEDKRVKSTWAKALAESDGNLDKATSLYIKERLHIIKEEMKAKKQLEEKKQKLKELKLKELKLKQKELKQKEKEIIANKILLVLTVIIILGYIGDYLTMFILNYFDLYHNIYIMTFGIMILPTVFIFYILKKTVWESE